VKAIAPASTILSRTIAAWMTNAPTDSSIRQALAAGLDGVYSGDASSGPPPERIGQIPRSIRISSFFLLSSRVRIGGSADGPRQPTPRSFFFPGICEAAVRALFRGSSASIEAGDARGRSRSRRAALEGGGGARNPMAAARGLPRLSGLLKWPRPSRRQRAGPSHRRETLAEPRRDHEEFARARREHEEFRGPRREVEVDPARAALSMWS
jgi:hypothetical protein